MPQYAEDQGRGGPQAARRPPRLDGSTAHPFGGPQRPAAGHGEHQVARAMWPVGKVGAELLGQEVGEWHSAALAGLGRPHASRPLDGQGELLAGQPGAAPPGPPLDSPGPPPRVAVADLLEDLGELGQGVDEVWVEDARIGVGDGQLPEVGELLGQGHRFHPL